MGEWSTGNASGKIFNFIFNHPKSTETILSQQDHGTENYESIVERRTEGRICYKRNSFPEPKPDEILFKVEKVGICGSDIALYAWNEVARTIATVPFIPGHEAAVVTALGSEVKNLSVGSR